MDGIFIELEADEVDAVQDIIDIEEDLEKSEIVFSPLGTPFPLPPIRLENWFRRYSKFANEW